MSCLFGDATDSELELDYILLIRDLFDFAVDVLRADEKIDEVEQALRGSAKAAGREKARLESLYTRLVEALDPEIDTEGAASRCADAIGRACRSTIDEEIARLDREISRERELADRTRKNQKVACARALERLLLVPHQLPATETELEVALAGELGYSATLRGRTEYGLDTVLDLEIPGTSVFGGPPVRAAHKVPTLELHVPEQRGWISKKVKQVKHKVGKLFIARIVVAPARITVSLRAEPSLLSEGYDLVMDADWEGPRVLPAGAGGEVPSLMEAHDVDAEDADAVQELFTGLVDDADHLRAHPTSLTDVSLDGVKLEDHEDPTELIDRLFSVMGPTVREIAEHSPQPDELVLKRSLGGDRREEIYVSREELIAKIDVLTPDQRARFAPLGFGAPKVPPAIPPSKPVASAPRPSVPPPPRARPAASSPPPRAKPAGTSPPPTPEAPASGSGSARAESDPAPG